MAKNAVIGLDLGSRTIKAVEVTPTRHGLVMTRAAVRPTPEGMIVNGFIIDESIVGAEVQKMLQEEGFTGKKAVVSCGGQTDIVVRVTEVPRMSERELKNAMKWDLERHLPFPVTQAKESVQYSVYDGPDVDPNSPNMEVTITVLKDEACEKLLYILKRAKLSPLAIDAGVFAAGRALVAAARDGFSEQCLAIVNIGAGATDISIVHHNLLRFNRVVTTIAGDTFTTAIGQSLIVEADEAEQLKLAHAMVSTELEAPEERPSGGPPSVGFRPPAPEPEHLEMIAPASQQPAFIETLDGPMLALDEEPGLPGTGRGGPVFGEPEFGVGAEPELGGMDVQDIAATQALTSDAAASRRQVSDALKPVVAELAAEINRSLDYYRTRHDDVDIERILLIGGSALIPNLAPVLQTELGDIATEVGNPYSAVRFDPEAGYTEDDLAMWAPVITVAMGLALHDLLPEPSS